MCSVGKAMHGKGYAAKIGPDVRLMTMIAGKGGSDGGVGLGESRESESVTDRRRINLARHD